LNVLYAAIETADSATREAALAKVAALHMEDVVQPERLPVTTGMSWLFT
jgi:hypothetical protein